MSKIYDTPKRRKAAFDRGFADEYYCRKNPTPRIWLDPLGEEEDTDLSPQEQRDYRQGADLAKRSGDRKDYGEAE